MPTPRRVQLLAEAIERDPRVNAKAFVVSEASGLLPVIRGEPPPWTKPAESEGSASDPARGSNNRSEEHTSELQSLMRISYAVFCLKKKIINHQLITK